MKAVAVVFVLTIIIVFTECAPYQTDNKDTSEKKTYTIENINPNNLQCDPNGCNSDCVAKGYPGGFCFAGSCWCILGKKPEVTLIKV
ncbi:defense protein 6-like isoform X4 [Anoplophora glabripennis]|uniref:defense protein 6-like isoform X4 n=1 Tax=Anoplophora glabripennis TaxID=217634 RepID=UPI00087564C3|nr:defense protein 6-like isoform X4 [Anoplophora glabripennis]